MALKKLGPASRCSGLSFGHAPCLVGARECTPKPEREPVFRMKCFRALGKTLKDGLTAPSLRWLKPESRFRLGIGGIHARSTFLAWVVVCIHAPVSFGFWCAPFLKGPCNREPLPARTRNDAQAHAGITRAHAHIASHPIVSQRTPSYRIVSHRIAGQRSSAQPLSNPGLAPDRSVKDDDDDQHNSYKAWPGLNRHIQAALNH